jgi:CheY-like chemotaxis protein
METQYSVLVVDDNPSDQHLIKTFFRKIDPQITVVSVNDGTELLIFFKSASKTEYPRFIITDINMPNLGGVEVIKYLKNDTILVDIPVYVLTSCSDFKTRVRSMITGASGFYEKPMHSGEFKAIFQDILTQEGLLVRVDSL